jgi:acetate---CoA ligase (ADP-forming) subunit beta
MNDSPAVLPLIADRARNAGRAFLTEFESKELLRTTPLSIIETRLAASRDSAVSLSRELGFPVVLKIASPDIVHKTEAGAVKLGLKTARQVETAYDQIMLSAGKAFPQARLDGVTVQRLARPGVEVIIGLTKDPQFGPVLMFGLGGILVEVLKDVSFRLVPLERRDAAEMIREIKGFPLLQGYRGQEPVDIACLEDILLQVSAFAGNNPWVKELDLNPVFAYKDSAVVVDARIIMENNR